MPTTVSCEDVEGGRLSSYCSLSLCVAGSQCVVLVEFSDSQVQRSTLLVFSLMWHGQRAMAKIKHCHRRGDGPMVFIYSD